MKSKLHQSLEFAAGVMVADVAGLTAVEAVVASRMPAMEVDGATVAAGATEAVHGATVAVDVAL